MLWRGVKSYGPFQHSLERLERFFHLILPDLNLRLFVPKCEIDFFECVELHERAFVTRARLIRWRRNKCFSWSLFFHLMKNAFFSRDDESFLGTCDRVFQKGRSASHKL